MKQFSKHFAIVLKEMFSRVKAEYEGFDFDNSEWYRAHEWTKEENESFKTWLINYLYNNAEARKELMSFSSKNKKRCTKLAEWFVFQWGWAFKKEDK